MNLTDLTVKNLSPHESGQRTYFDDTLKGFGVRVSQGGTKSFVFVHGTNRKRHTIGRYPDISLKKARQKAKRILADATLHKHLPETITFKDARMRYLSAMEDQLRPKTYADYKGILEGKLNSLNGSISDITVQQMMKEIDKLRHTPRMQSYTFAVLRKFLNWCVQHQYLRASPLTGMPTPKLPPSRARILTDDELKAVYAAATDYPFGTILKLLIHTGQRRGEIAGLRWEWLSDVIEFPAEITKNKRAHTIPITTPVQTTIDALPKSNDTYLFPATRTMSKNTTVFNGFSKAKAKFDKRVDIEHWTLHDLRRTFASNLAKLNTPIHITEKLLNHSSGTISGIVAIYNRHSYIDEMKAALTAYDEYLAQICKS